MTKKANTVNSNHKKNPDASYNHSRRDPVTGQLNWYVPVEIEDDITELLARKCGFEVCFTRLGCRRIWAFMLPCMDKEIRNGVEVYVPTPEAVQYERYLNYVRPILREQDREKHDGRCEIPNGLGGVRRCPLREENPEYIPGSEAKRTRFKTRVKSCVGCPYEEFKRAHTVVSLDELSHEYDDGTVVPFESSAGTSMMEGDLFEMWSREFIDYVRVHKPKLVRQLELQMLGYSNSEISRILGLPTSTVTSRSKKLQELFDEYWVMTIRP